MTEATISITLEVEVDVSGTIMAADPSVGLGEMAEDVCMDSLTIEWKPQPVSQPKTTKMTHSVPSADQKFWLDLMKSNPGQKEFFIPRATLFRLCRAIPEWLEAHIIEAYEEEIQSALTEDYGVED